MNSQRIACPSCGGGIPFDAKLLVQGIQFNCPECGISIGLPIESQQVVRAVLDRLEDTKRRITASPDQEMKNDDEI